MLKKYLNKEIKIKEKGENLIMNRISKKVFLILLFTMLFTGILSKEANAATYNTRTSLYNAGKNAVGKTVRIYRSGTDAKDAFEQDHESSHVYCVQHNVTTIKKKYYDYQVKNYIKITGNVATNSKGQSIVSNKNLALAYLLEKESYRKGYVGGEDPQEVRNLAIKHYLTTGGWLNEVGKKLGISGADINYFNIKDADRGTTKKNNVIKLVNNAIAYSKKSIGIPATMKLSPTLVKPSTMKQLGPVKITFTGNLQSIQLFNGNTEVKDSKTFTVGGKTKTISQITTGNNVIINRNTENKVTKIKATSNGEYIEAEMWLCVKANAKQNLLIVKSTSTSKPATASINVAEVPKKEGQLIINKVDKDTGKALSAGFKIQTSSGKWLKGTNGSYTYNNTFANATKYKASTITLNKLNYGTYKIYEVEAPNTYNLASQPGYDKNNKWVYFGTATINAKNAKVTKTIKNTKPQDQKIAIKGYVWIDTPETKGGAYNSLYDSTREARVPEVTVNLVNKSTKKAIATTKTNANGEYIFDKLINSSQLKNYYVQFDYSGLDNLKTTYKDAEGKEQKYINYIPVAFNSKDANAIVANGSRALLDSVATEDTKLSGAATTYKGTDSQETTYGLSGNLKNKLMEGTVLNNINLGLKEIPKADYNLAEKLDYVKITMKGYTYTYDYGDAGKANYTTAPSVNWQKVGTISGYTANIYPSYIAYKSENGKEDLKVDVGYIINITNTTTIGTGDSAKNYNEIYKEKALYISSLTNTYDHNRYTLNDSNWTENGDVAKYQKEIGGIASGKTSPGIKINFSVKRDAILDILKHPYGIIEKYPTTANTIGYHKYDRYDYGWNYKISTNQEHRTVNESMEASAPYLIFKLAKEKRTISGKVFEDTVTDESKAKNEKLGDGINNSEKGVSGVKVQLLDVSVKDNKEITDITKLSVSHLYDVQGEGIEERTVLDPIPAETLTNENGEYILTGLVPGDYYLRFIYGNGEYKITDLDGKVINEGNINAKIGDKEISAKDYKSTIVVDSPAKDALMGIENENTVMVEEYIKEGTTKKKSYIWYKKLQNDNFSVALDSLNTRIAVNQGALQNMIAGTAKLSIRIESDLSNATGVKGTNDIKENETISNGENTANVKVEYLNEVANQNICSGLNLGIIEVPNQEVKVEKIITNMKLTTADNRIVFNGNPETNKLQGVSDLDNVRNGGSTNARTELSDEIIDRATLELTYTIKVTNVSDVNYYNNEYYYYGKAASNKEVTFEVKEIVDYLDETLQFDKAASTEGFDDTATDDTIAGNEELAKKTVIKLANWNKKLYTEKNTTRNNGEYKTSDSVVLVAHGYLTDNSDMEFINRVKVSKADNGIDDRDKDTSKEAEIQIVRPIIFNSEMAQARAAVMPPTGADRQTIIIYTVIGTLALAVLSAGIIVIKKYVVK